MTFEGFFVDLTEQFFDEPPLEKLAPSGGGERHAVRERGGQFFDEPPLEKLAPSGGRERHAVRERGGHVLSGCQPVSRIKWAAHAQRQR